MAKNPISVAIDTAVSDTDELDDAVDEGASRAVKQLAVLLEGPMKKHAPEGATGDFRDSIDTKFRRGGKTANVGARKRTRDGGLLAEIIVEGTDATSYTATPPLVAFLGEQLQPWAAAKLGDPDLGYAVAWSIARTGHTTLPNPFVQRAYSEWRGQVGDIAGEAVADELSKRFGGP